MYAVVNCGGKQHRVSPGDILQVERLNLPEKEKVELSEVLLISEDDKDIQVGTPFVEGAKVVCSVLREQKGKKIIIFKMKRRKGYRRKKGHRQIYSIIQVEDIITEKPKPKAIEKPAVKETKPKAKTKPAAKETKAKPKKKPAAKKVEVKAKAAEKPKAKTKAKPAAKKPATKIKAAAKPVTKTKKKATPKSKNKGAS